MMARWLARLAVGVGAFGGTSALAADQHDTTAIVAALRSPIPPEIIAQTRQLDDQLLASGVSGGARVFLVTDHRLSRVNGIAHRLLTAMGEDADAWIVRVLDTTPPVSNAYVFGGKYVYIYTGLIDAAQSDDELAMVIGHELGHSLLKHLLRRADDDSSTWADLAILLGQLSRKHRDGLELFAKGLNASYNRIDEEEADALGVAIARRAGFEPLRGTDFFNRSRRSEDRARAETDQQLAQQRATVAQSQVACTQWQRTYAQPQYHNVENWQTMTNVCRDSEIRRVQYNTALANVTNARQFDPLLRSHPFDEHRIAAIAAVSDHLAGRRDLASLAPFRQSQRVMIALGTVNSVLLQPPLQTLGVAKGDRVSKLPPKQVPDSLTDKLAELKRARDSDLITIEEYNLKRAQIVESY